jgi:hypothetical protein
MMTRLIAVSALAAMLTASSGGCDEPVTPPRPQVSASLPGDLVISSAPEGARTVAEVRQSAAPSERVIVRGVVAGTKAPIAENRAVLTLLDESIATCDRNPDDGCATPWDACCEPKDVIAANAVTVQVVDGQGQPLRASLAGAGGLAPLSRVVVVGTFVPSPDGKSAVVNATALHVVP